MDTAAIYEAVNDGYSTIASHAHLQSPELLSQSKSTQIASSMGYSARDLDSLPPGTNLGLSCGNPLATARLQPSDTVLDLGSGGGLDCIIAGKRMVGMHAHASPTGKIYGVDRSEAMIALARKNATNAGLGHGLVEFIHAPISNIPLPDSMVDLVVSNCVINLVPDDDKPDVFREIYRVLKPGGRLSISDLLAKRELPDHIRQDAALLVGCVAGASLVADYRRWMLQAGFRNESMVFVDTGNDLNVYHDHDHDHDQGGASCCGGEMTSGGSSGGQGETVGQLDLNELVASYQIQAVKETGSSSQGFRR